MTVALVPPLREIREDDLGLARESHARRLFLRDRRPELYAGWLSHD